MHMNDCTYKHVIRGRVVSYLKDFPLPVRKTLKAGKIKGFNSAKYSVFQETIETDNMIPVPKIFYDMCGFISEHVDREGIFKEEGSRPAQENIKKKIKRKEMWLNENVDVIDVAVLLKYYVKELPVPLIPPVYHELFFACLDLDNKQELLVVAALLLPIENLNLLCYLMKFFRDVSSFSKSNKMNSYNLAVCIAPSVLPIRAFSSDIPVKTTEITKIFIENAAEIGIIPVYIQRRFSLSEQCNEKKKQAHQYWINFKRKFLAIFRKE